MLYLFQILNGLGLGMIYFLISAGLTIIFGLLNFVNFAHGAFFMMIEARSLWILWLERYGFYGLSGAAFSSTMV